ncbi:MAG: GNAT family N-acetyltransferase [Clostridia bacterium]|nr:GNAT family N-acetyltransferase [Clostridia bacterium]
MAVRFSETKEFTKAQLSSLYASVGHPDAHDPAKLKAAAAGSARVISAWRGKQLVGLIRALDDGVMLAYVCEMIVDPAQENQQIAAGLQQRMRSAYSDAFRVFGLP